MWKLISYEVIGSLYAEIVGAARINGSCIVARWRMDANADLTLVGYSALDPMITAGPELDRLPVRPPDELLDTTDYVMESSRASIRALRADTRFMRAIELLESGDAPVALATLKYGRQILNADMTADPDPEITALQARILELERTLAVERGDKLDGDPEMEGRLRLERG